MKADRRIDKAAQAPEFRYRGAWRLWVPATIISLFATVLLSSSANGDAWPNSYLPDANPHTYCLDTILPAAYHDDVHKIEKNSLGDPTDANVSFQTTCKISGSSETDVVWQKRNLGSSTRGSSFCDQFNPLTGKCDQWYAQVNIDLLLTVTYPAYNIRKTMCHELGHTVGLVHHSETSWGCMKSGWVNQDTAMRRYNAHHKGHINGYF